MPRLHLVLFTLLTLVLSPSARAQKWITYEGSTFQEHKYYDGDSFQIKAPTGYTYIFRLYGADTLETDNRFPSRIAEQAEYFHIPQKRVIHWGKVAKRFTRRFLRGKVTIHTRKEKSGSRSSKHRYYAIVIDDQGRRLDEALIEAGLARAHGVSVSYPKKTNDRTFQRRLHRLELKAKRNKIGIWAESIPLHQR